VTVVGCRAALYEDVPWISLDHSKRIIDVAVLMLTGGWQMLVAEPDGVVGLPDTPDSLHGAAGAIFASSVAPKRTSVK
jgi:hypothetical protein